MQRKSSCFAKIQVWVHLSLLKGFQWLHIAFRINLTSVTKMPLPDQILGPWLSLFPLILQSLHFWYISILGTHLAKGTSQVLPLEDIHLSCFSIFTIKFFFSFRSQDRDHFVIENFSYYLNIMFWAFVYFISSASFLFPPWAFKTALQSMLWACAHVLTDCVSCMCFLSPELEHPPHEGRASFHPAHHISPSTWYCAGRMVPVWWMSVHFKTEQ